MKQRSSDQTSTIYLNNNNSPIATTNATSTPPATWPSQKSNKMIQGWFSQQTKGWPWSSWIQRITPTKTSHFFKTRTPTKCSKKDPTSQLKNKIISILKAIKSTGGLSTNKYKQLYPTSTVPPKFYGLPKIHKLGTPLRPMVSSRGSNHLWCSKRDSIHHQTLGRPIPTSPQKHPAFCTTNFRAKSWNPGEVITSFDVKALFTSVPVLLAIQIVKQRLQQDTTLPQRTNMSIPQITSPTGVLPHQHLLPLPG